MIIGTQSPMHIPPPPHVVLDLLTHCCIEQQTLSDLQRESMKAVNTTIALFTLAALSPAAAFVPSAASRAALGRTRGERGLRRYLRTRCSLFMFLFAPPARSFRCERRERALPDPVSVPGVDSTLLAVSVGYQ